jgi:hypothetical protein
VRGRGPTDPFGHYPRPILLKLITDYPPFCRLRVKDLAQSYLRRNHTKTEEFQVLNKIRTKEGKETEQVQSSQGPQIVLKSLLHGGRADITTSKLASLTITILGNHK